MPLAPLVVFAYALVMLAGGLYAFLNAPPEANRATALIIPGACGGVMSILGVAMLRGRATSRRGRPLIFVAATLAMLFAGAIRTPAAGRAARMENYPGALHAWEAAAASDPALAARAAADPSVRKAFFAERSSPDHDQTYLVRTLWTLCAASAVTSVLLFAMAFFARPRA